MTATAPFGLDGDQPFSHRDGARARFGLRVNPDVEAGPHPYLRTGHDETKFGLPARTAVELFRRVAAGAFPNLDPVGVHVHVGSQLADPSELAAGARVALGVLRAGRQAGLALDRLDVGGGLPVAYDGGPVPSRRRSPPHWPGCWPVPGSSCRSSHGRAVVARAGALVASVLATKPRPGGRAVVVDTGMHHLLRPALYRWCRFGSGPRPAWPGWSVRSVSPPTSWPAARRP